MIRYDMIYLLTAIGFSPGGSSTVHIYTQIIYRTTQQLEECGPCPVLTSYTLAFVLQPRIWYDMIRYDMVYLLTAIGLSPGGSSTVHIYTQTILRTTQQLEECGPCPVLASYTLAFALQPRKK